MGNTNMKLIPKSKVSGNHHDLDSIKVSFKDDPSSRRRGMDVLLQAYRYYSNMDRFRKDRERNKRYNYGDQWGDRIQVDGKWMTEEQYLLEQGNVPLKQNLIRRLTRNVLGTFKNQSKEPTCTARDRDEQTLGETMSTILQANRQLNRMTDVDARSMEEFLISGLVVHKKWYGWRNDKMDCWTDYVAPNNFFIDNNMRDFRGWDCSCLGELHDETFGDIVGEFCTSPEDYQRLKSIYRCASDRAMIADHANDFGFSRMENWDFLCPSNPSLCRVVEVWCKERKPRYRCHDYNNGDFYKIDEEDYDEMVAQENNRRLEQGLSLGMPKEEIPLIETEWFMDNYWYYYYLTPFGDILAEGETPYAHKSHPYVFKAYPFIDGEIHSFVSDVIDQQRYTNRLIILYDWMMRVSAKGALLFPEDALPEGFKMEDIAESWAKVGSVIAFKAKAGVPLPQQISTNLTNIGIGDLLNLQLKFFEDISGVNGALQGKPGYSSTSGSLYAQQTQNATTSLLDLLDTYSSFVVDGAYKDVKNMQQYYDSKRVFNIAGNSAAHVEYDPKRLRDVEFDLSIVESTNTAAYREVANAFLMQIWQSGQISLEQMLQTGSFPFSDELLQSIQSQKEQVNQGQLPQGVSPQLMQEAASQGNPEAQDKVQQMLQQQPNAEQ